VKALVLPLAIAFGVGNFALAQQSQPPNESSPPATAAPSSPATGAPPQPNMLLDGTPVKLRLAENLTSATAKAGQQVSFEVLEEVDVMGVPVIAKGAPALATVTTAEPKRTMGRGGKLDVNVDSVRLIDGEKVALSATQNAKGGGHTGAMTAGMVGTAIIFFPAAPLLLFIHGKDITIPKGTPVTAFVAGDMKLDMAKMVVPGAAPAVVTAVVATTTANLTVESSVTGADITVDGNFVGSTPSTVSVAVGQHTIAVTKKGYADWSRTMNVSGSSVHLSAELEAKP
jgi:hypothetical protein